MPHLSPMNWLMFIPLMWLIIFSLISSTMSPQPMKPTINLHSSSYHSRPWPWS